MKTKLTRISKRTLAMILTVLMMISMMIVGTVTAGAWDINQGATIWFDNTEPNWSSVYLYVFNNDTSVSYKMTRYSDTNFWYYHFDFTWSNMGGFIFRNTNGSNWPDKGQSVNYEDSASGVICFTTDGTTSQNNKNVYKLTTSYTVGVVSTTLTNTTTVTGGSGIQSNPYTVTPGTTITVSADCTTCSPDNTGKRFAFGTSTDYSTTNTHTVVSSAVANTTYSVYVKAKAEYGGKLSKTAVQSGTIYYKCVPNTYSVTIKRNPTEGGNVTIGGTSNPTTAQIGSTAVNITATPKEGYQFKNWTTSNSNITVKNSTSSSTSVTATGTGTLTANFEKIPCTVTYTLGNNVTYSSSSGGTHNSTSKTITAYYGDTVSLTVDYASGYEYDPDNSIIPNGASVSTDKKTFTFSNITANKSITIKAREFSNFDVEYFIDMHNNTVSASKTVEVAVVTSSNGGTVKKDNNGNDCKGTLTKVVGSSTVYSAKFTTPLVKSNPLYLRIKYGTTYYYQSLTSAQVQQLAEKTTKEIWLEATNEASQTLSMTPSKPSKTVQSGYKRIYLDRVTSGNTWTNVYIYCWNEKNESFTTWDNSTKMTIFKTTTGHVYYYADIPTKYATNVIFHNGNSGNGNQTGDIKDIGTTNYFQLSSTETALQMDTVIAAPECASYYSNVKMNLKETDNGAVNIAPTLSNSKFTVTYTSDNKTVADVDAMGNIIPKASGDAQITVKVSNSLGDSKSYYTNVKINDPTKFKEFKIMSIESQTSTISITPKDVASFPEVSTLLTGVANVPKNSSNGYKNSAIVTIDGSNCTVKYAKPNNQFYYGDIYVTATVKTKSEKYTSNGRRYGIKCWQKNFEENPEINKTITKSITDGVETATSKMTLDGSKFEAIYEEYEYVDVTFNFKYYEYKTLRSIPKTDADGNPLYNDKGEPIYEELNFYQYDPQYIEDNGFENTHNEKVYTVSDFEVRNLTADKITKLNIRASAIDAIVDMPENDYYTYVMPDFTEESSSVVINPNTVNHTATVDVSLIQKPRTYSVSVGGNKITKYNKEQQNTDQNENPVYYQSYVTATVGEKSNWYDEKSGALLATGKSYRFRVTNDTELEARPISGEENKDNRTAISLSGYELTHEESASDPGKKVEKLVQNFYIADFFDPARVTREDGAPRDDVKFVGGGVAYYSYTKDSADNKTFNQNVIDAGYVHGQNVEGSVYGEANADAIKNKLKAVIEKNIAGGDVTDSEDLAKAIAYGTEIKPTVDKVSGRSTGLVYRYLPYEQYKRSGDALEKDDEGKYTFATKINSNVFRYSTALKAYQYIYASKAENKESNANKYMRTYSYYIYSYTAYDEETDLPTTEYEVVLSDNYSDAATYWENTP